MVPMARNEVFDPQEVVIGHLYNRTCLRCFLMGNDQSVRQKLRSPQSLDRRVSETICSGLWNRFASLCNPVESFPLDPQVTTRCGRDLE